MPHLTAIVTLLAILLYFYTALLVAQARRRTGIKAPQQREIPNLRERFEFR